MSRGGVISAAVLLALLGAVVIVMDALTHGGLFKHAAWAAIRSLWAS